MNTEPINGRRTKTWNQPKTESAMLAVARSLTHLTSALCVSLARHLTSRVRGAASTWGWHRK